MEISSYLISVETTRGAIDLCVNGKNLCDHDPPPDVIHFSRNNLVAVFQRHHGETTHSVKGATQRHQVERATLLGKHVRV